jgi:hypothetical protein
MTMICTYDHDMHTDIGAGPPAGSSPWFYRGVYTGAADSYLLIKEDGCDGMMF